MSLAVVAVRGSILSCGVMFGGRALNLVLTIVLARLLLPNDFGLIAAAMLILDFMGLLRDIGTVDALIYSPDNCSSKCSTGFWINITLGTIQCALIYFMAPLGVYIFDDSRIVQILQALAICPFIQGITLTHDALLLKELRFQRRYLCEFVSIFVKTAICIVLAYDGMGVWAIVIGQIAGMLALSVSRVACLPWLPAALPSLDQARKLFHYGKHVAAVGLLGLVVGRTDQIVITTVIGNAALGYYFIGMRIPELLLSSICMSLTSVIFPLFSTLNRSHDQLVNALLETVRYAALVMIPMGVGMALIARELIVVLFGWQWEPAIPVLQFLAISWTMPVLHWSTGDALKATGRPDVVFKLMLLEVVYVPLIIWSTAYLTGQLAYTAAAILGVSTLRAVVRAYVGSRCIGFDLGRYLALFKVPVQAALLMAVSVYVFRTVVTSIPELLSMLMSITIGVCVYVGAIWTFERELVVRGFAILRQGLGIPGAAPADPLVSCEKD